MGIVFCFLLFLIMEVFYLEAEFFTCCYYMHSLDENNKTSYELKIEYDCLAIECSLFLYRD